MKTVAPALVATMLALTACGEDATADATEEIAAGTPVDPTVQSSDATHDSDVEASDVAATVPAAVAPARGGFSLMDFRYCEILLTVTVTDDDGTEVTEVWGTPGVGPCTDEAWSALDPAAIRAEADASFIRMNGPRHFVVDGTADTGDGAGGTGVAAGGATTTRQFGDITMALLATTEASEEGLPYEPDLVARTTTWTYAAGTEVHELTDPDGNVYTMQSYSLTEDRSLTAADLSALGDRLELPDGWSYRSSVLDEPLQLALSPNGAIVVQDEFDNSYQRNG